MSNDRSSGNAIREKRSFFEFTDNTRAIIHGLKYHNRPRAACSLVKAAIRTYDIKEDININAIVPVPLHWYKQLRRGYNQATLIARVVSEECNVPVINAIKRVSYGKSQTKKNRRARTVGVERAFTENYRLKSTIEGKVVLLIDDVYTTGATSEKCAEILLNMGAKEVNLLTIASVDAE